MQADYIRQYLELFEVNFVEVNGKIFSNIDLKASDPLGFTTLDENTSNSERFRFFPENTIEGVYGNHALASAVKVVWESRLAALFPRGGFRCFVSNEYVLWPEDKDPNTIAGEGVETVLRLW